MTQKKIDVPRIPRFIYLLGLNQNIKHCNGKANANHQQASCKAFPVNGFVCFPIGISREILIFRWNDSCVIAVKDCHTQQGNKPICQSACQSCEETADKRQYPQQQRTIYLFFQIQPCRPTIQINSFSLFVLSHQKGTNKRKYTAAPTIREITAPFKFTQAKYSTA